MEGPAPNYADAVGDRDRDQITATTEGKIQNAGETLCYGYGCHTAAAIEGSFANAVNTLRNSDRRQTGALEEGSFANAGERQSRNLCGYLQITISCPVTISNRHLSISNLV